MAAPRRLRNNSNRDMARLHQPLDFNLKYARSLYRPDVEKSIFRHTRTRLS